MIYNRLLSAGIKAFIETADRFGKAVSIVTEHSTPAQHNRDMPDREITRTYLFNHWTKEYTDTEIILTGLTGTVVRIKYVDISTLSTGHHIYAPRVRQWFIAGEYVHECALMFAKLPEGLDEYYALTGFELGADKVGTLTKATDQFVERVIQQTFTNSLACLITPDQPVTIQLLGSHRLAKILPMAYPVHAEELPGAVILGVSVSDPVFGISYDGTEVTFNLNVNTTITVPMGYIGLLDLTDGDSYLYRATSINSTPLIVKAIIELNEKQVADRRNAIKRIK